MEIPNEILFNESLLKSIITPISNNLNNNISFLIDKINNLEKSNSEIINKLNKLEESFKLKKMQMNPYLVGI